MQSTRPFRTTSRFDPASVRVAVVLPLRNEARDIAATIDSLLNQTFSREQTEIIAVDGMSDDATRAILAEYARQYAHLRLLDNPGRTVPTAMNIGIAATTADIIVRVDGHCRLEQDYVERCVIALAESGAPNVGGLMHPRGEGIVGQAISLALCSRFGIGNGRFHYLRRREFVDTVYLGAFRREVLEELGGYDEELTRNQDDELNYRIRRAGYGILLSPDIVSTYTPRDSFCAVWRQFYQYGLWKVRVIKKHPGSAQLRHLAPLCLVLGLFASIVAFAVDSQPLLLIPVAAYLTMVLLAASYSSRSSLQLLPALAVVFACLHLGYGSGFLMAIIREGLRAASRRGGSGASYSTQ